jgi:hypothetical protein
MMEPPGRTRPGDKEDGRQYVNLKLTLLAALLVAALIGGWAVLNQTPTSSQTPTPEERLAEKIEHYNATKNQPPTMDPTAIAEKDARQQRQIAASQEEHARWLEDFKTRDVDLRSLAWLESGAFYDAGPSTIEEAVREAAAIVSGTATQVEFRASGFSTTALVQFHVAEVIAGTAEDVIELVLGGGPVRNLRTGEAALAYNAPAPLLLPGDEAILILNAHPRNPGVLVPQSFTGINKIRDGIVRASKHGGEDLATSLVAGPRRLYDGVSKAEFIALLKEVIARN